MSTHPESVKLGPIASTWRRLHQALMPDYNRKAAAYWWTMVLLGGAVIALSINTVASWGSGKILQALAGVLIATLAGLFPLRIPRSKNSFAAGEIYIFLLLAIHGPAPAALAAACEAGLGAFRTSKRWTSRIFTPAMAALSLFACGCLFQAMVRLLHSVGWLNPGAFIALLMGLGAVYAVANSVLVSAVLKLKRNEPLSMQNWVSDWGWVGLTFVATGALAGLLFLTFEKFGVSVLVVSVPMLALFLAALHYFFAQQSASEREQAARVEAAERVALQAAKHARELQHSDQRFESAFTHAAIGMALVSTEGSVRQANRALAALLGCDVGRIAGHEFRDFVFEDDAPLLQERLDRVIAREIESFSLELRCRDLQQRDIWVSLHCGFFADPSATEPCLIFQVHDVTARRRAETHLQHVAYHDSLTGLANRSRFNECLLHALQDQRDDPSRRFAVMYLDFDRFKLINDSLGHGAGDEFLLKVARRLREHVRPSDVLARLGGDEFAILTSHIGDTDHAIALAERLQQTLRKPLLIAGKEISTSASIGITFSDIGYRTPEEVLRDADLAMYKAKAKGKAQYALFDSSLHRVASEQLSLEMDLRRAIGSGGLSVVYQPIYLLAPRRLVAFEALVRWHHPQRGLISPSVFIPLAEEAGLIESVGEWVLDQACAQLSQWHQQYPQMSRVGLHVNASSLEFASPTFPQRVSQTLERYALRPSFLVLEITENALMDRMELAAGTMAQLRQLGVGLSIDDFGTGYSSLSYLSVLPINSLKIDRSFVSRLQGSAESSEIVRAILTLGLSLGKQVIAEGIETEAQLNCLEALGCGHGQGYLLAEPLAPRQVASLLSECVADLGPRARASNVIAFEPAADAPIGAPRRISVH